MEKSLNILGKLVFIVVLLTIVGVTYFFYSKYYFNDYTKAQVKSGISDFYKDSTQKINRKSSYCIENKDYNDSVFYKKLKLEPNTAYRITCKVKTEKVNVKYEEEELKEEDAKRYGIGACISVLDTTEQSNILAGNSDWEELELMFNSKNREYVNLGFRLGGYNGEAKGKAWFGDIKVEKAEIISKKWNVICFNINNIDVTIKGKNYKVLMTKEDQRIIRENLQRFALTMDAFSDGKMNINTKCIEISEPLTSLSYSNENGYYIEPKDVYNLIHEYLDKNEYDHIFIGIRLGDVTTNVQIPVNSWIGLGGMRYKDIGFSNIRLPNDMKNTTMYKYDLMSDTFPEEVFVHEFLHTLERNLGEYGYEFPALHDNAKYDYREEGTDSLKKWYKDYLRGMIKSNDGYVGLSSEIYLTKPLHLSDFQTATEVEFDKETDMFFVGVYKIIASLFSNQDEDVGISDENMQVEITE